jgi:2,3-bisphosphoglycerate-independent phosphoglycerate mutase
MDGVGIGEEGDNNAVSLANTPNLDGFFNQPAYTLLQASGKSVGLPDGQMGNSEVGHLTLGCGTILRQDLVRIDDAIDDQSLFNNPRLLDAINKSIVHQRPLHLVGLVSDGGVHSHINHLIALITLCQQHHVIPVIHMITDGRDTPPRSALTYLEQLQEPLAKARGQIATISGRYFAMDRDKRWERTHAAWQAMCYGEGIKAANARAAIEQAYASDTNDEFISPTVISKDHLICQQDEVVFFNFRNDRARQLTYVFSGTEFKPFDRGIFSPISLTCLTEYDPKLDLPIVFPAEFPQTTLSQVIADAGIKQLHCAETEKYAHVTFFFNGGVEQECSGETRAMIASPEVSTYDLKPEMSAAGVTQTIVDAMSNGEYGFIVVNFANGDMVGHTAKADAVVKAVEALDEQVGIVVEQARRNDFSVIITADHGNCEMLVDPISGQPHTQHTTNPVPCAVLDDDVSALNDGCGLSHIAPAVLALMGLEKPTNMDNQNIIHFDVAAKTRQA